MVPIQMRQMMIAIALVISTLAFSRVTQSSTVLGNSPKALVDQAWQLVQREYVDRTFNHQDWIEVRRGLLDQDYRSTAEAYQTIQTMVNSLGDEYTRFLPPEALKDLVDNVSGDFIGVGLVVGQDPNTREWIVVRPFPESPAASVGIKPWDVITSINGTKTSEIRLDQAAPYLIGPVGSKVKLQVRRQNQDLQHELVREQINLNPLTYQVYETKTGKLGYIRLPVFTTKSPPAMKQAITQLESKGVKGYILDLRGNPGGVLDSGIAIAQMWINQGKIMTLKKGTGEIEEYQGNRKALTTKPLQVLVDEKSASASEVLAAALQDNERAKLLGHQTFGKGIVQSLEQLGEGAGLVITIAQYFTPNGKNIHKRGIQPDEILAPSAPPGADVSAHNFERDLVFQTAKRNLLP